MSQGYRQQTVPLEEYLRSEASRSDDPGWLRRRVLMTAEEIDRVRSGEPLSDVMKGVTGRTRDTDGHGGLF